MNPDSRPKTLLVLPNDPLERYADKGEVKPRYFNPENFFDRVHVVTLADSDSGIDAARVMAGRAEVEIHPVGRPGPLNFRAVFRGAHELAGRLRPHVVRGYNPLLMGWLAVKLAGSTGAASAVSVHADYDLRRIIGIHGPGFLLSARGVYQVIHSLFGLNRTSIGRADRVICAYRFPESYVRRWRGGDISVIYNRVDLDRFMPAEDPSPRPGELRVLTVGRQFDGKDPSPLLEAAAAVDGVSLTLVGDGPLHGRLRDLAANLSLGGRARFIPRMDHADLPRLYRAHDAFAICITHPGIAIPVLEAAASGLPVAINRPLWEAKPEVVGGLAEVVEPSADGFRLAFERLRDDPAGRLARGRQLRALAEKTTGRASERAEADIYRELYNRVADSGGEG